MAIYSDSRNSYYGGKPPVAAPKPPKVPGAAQYYEPAPGWHSPTSPEYQQIADRAIAGAGANLPTGGMTYEDILKFLGAGQPSTTNNNTRSRNNGASSASSVAAAAAAEKARQDQLAAVEAAYKTAGTNVNQAYSGGQAALTNLMNRYAAIQQAQLRGAQRTTNAFGVPSSLGMPAGLSAADYLASVGGNLSQMGASDRANIDATLAAYQAALAGKK